MYDRKTKLKFKRNVQINSRIGCYDWIGSRHPSGYGMFYTGGQKIYAHRYLYELVNGPIAPGMELDHLCNRKCCCKPSHLQEVSHRENMKRAADRGSWDGENNSQSKYSDNDVFIIKFLAKIEGVSPRRIAVEMGIPDRTAYYLASPKGWKHLEVFFTF